MGSWSNKIHIAKKTLSTLCDNCSGTIDKGEKYNVHTNQFIGRWVCHASCPLQKMSACQKLQEIGERFHALDIKTKNKEYREIKKILESEGC